MRKNNPLKIIISFKTKIKLIIFGLFLCFVLIETGLRLVGFLFFSAQERRNIQSRKQEGTYRIMCLGESTTAGQYPKFLEQALNQSNIGVRFSVIDKGIVGINTSAILSQVEYYLNDYNPDMVVTMMGINDTGKHIPFEINTTSKTMLLIRPFRIYKLIRLLWLHILTKAEEIRTPKPDIGEQPFEENQVELKLMHAESIPSEDSFRKAIEINPENDRAYTELGWIYREQGRHSEAVDLFNKALELNPENDRAYVELGRVCQAQGKHSEAADLFNKALELDPENDRTYGAFAVLYEETGKPELAIKYAKKTNELRSQHYDYVIASNHRKLKEILDKRGIRLVCAQYPMRNVEPLRNIFKQDEGIVFVDNESIFKKAIKQASCKEYFVDMFGGDFGHCTKKGNQLLAQNIADTILKEVFHK